MTVTNVEYERGPARAGSGQPLAIGLRGVHKNFGSVEAVKGIDLDIASGEIVAFLGPNGAGKTSTIDIILGLVLTGLGTILGGVNFVTTIFCMRAPGMTMFRMPMF